MGPVSTQTGKGGNYIPSLAGHVRELCFQIVQVTLTSFAELLVKFRARFGAFRDEGVGDPSGLGCRPLRTALSVQYKEALLPPCLERAADFPLGSGRDSNVAHVRGGIGGRGGFTLAHCRG